MNRTFAKRSTEFSTAPACIVADRIRCGTRSLGAVAGRRADHLREPAARASRRVDHFARVRALAARYGCARASIDSTSRDRLQAPQLEALTASEKNQLSRFESVVSRVGIEPTTRRLRERRGGVHWMPLLHFRSEIREFLVRCVP